MGPENSKTGGLDLYKADGTKIGKIHDLAEVTVSAGKQIESVMCPAMAGFSATINVKCPKHWRCGSRKRFIKLMMSEGITRNYAERLADFTRRLMPYQEAWRNHLLYEFWRGLDL